MGNDFVDYEITRIRQGSVIIDGQILTRNEISDSVKVAKNLEKAIIENGSQLGGNIVDTEKITINGNLFC